MSKCAVEGCGEAVRYKGLCGKHYKRQWRHGDASITLIDMNREPFECCVEGCGKPGRYPATKMCHAHHTRWLRYGRTERERTPFGEGRPRTSAGYVLITRDGKRVYEHIYLAEKALRKKLPPEAVVHHMNEDPADNFTPFNLVICPDQAYHLLLHRRAEELRLTGKCSSLDYDYIRFS